MTAVPKKNQIRCRSLYTLRSVRKIIGSILVMAVSLTTLGQSQDAPAWQLYYDSTQLFWEKDWPKTVALLKHAEQSASDDLGIYDVNYLTIINDLGVAYWRQKDYRNAETFLSKSLNIKREVYPAGDNEIFRSISNLAGLYSEQGRTLQAKQLYKKIVLQAPDGIEHDLYRKAAKNLVWLYETHDEMDSALHLLDVLHANGARHTIDQPLQEYEIRLARGRINRKLRKYEEAKVILESLLEELKGKNAPGLAALYIQSLQESGFLYLSTGAFNKAEKNILQGFRLLKAQQPVDNALLTEVLNSLASVYEKLSIYDKAVAYYQEALSLCQQLQQPNSLLCTTLQSNLAGIHLKQGNIPLAISSYEQIRKNLAGVVPESSPFFITILNNLASAYRKNNQYPQASQHLEQAYQLIQKYKLENDDLAATVMNNMAVLLTVQGKYDQAIPYYTKAYDIKRVAYGDNSVLLMDMASNMAVVYWALKQPDKAIPLFQQSIALAIRQINYVFPNLSEDEQVQFYKKLKEDFERFNTIAFQASSTNPALLTQVFNNQLIIKSLIFFTNQHRNSMIQSLQDSVLSAQYERLKERREQLGHVYQLSLKEQAQVGVSTRALEQEIDALEKSISLKTSENVAEKMMMPGAQWRDIRNKLQPQEALIELIRFRKYDFKASGEELTGRVNFGFTDSVYYAALITTKETTSNPHLVLLKHGTHMEGRLLTYYKNALTFGVPDEYSYNSYWKPFDASLRGKTEIYFSGDGVYHKMNVNTLRDPVTGRFIIEQYDIHYLLNPVQYLEERKKSFRTRQAVLMGDPVFTIGPSASSKMRNDDRTYSALPGTYTEVVRIDELLKQQQWSTDVYLKSMATEKNLKNVHSPGILHIATHGFFLTDAASQNARAKKDFLFHSGLILSGATKNAEKEADASYEDGVVTAYEVMNLDLSNTDLVVLSACETGLGKIENGEGVYGLQRSFLQAGARDILISLWKVNDQFTQELMVKFYQYLFQGKSKREALKLAQMDQLRTLGDPIHWGAFIMVGVD
jgi:CHAT domain-containing protein/Tfp pilus assembly protein PilF